MIIGFAHRREVGKDLAGTVLQSELKIALPDLEVRRVAFADPLYEICKILYGHLGFRSKEYYDQNKNMKDTPLPEIDKSPRQILIDMGTPAIREKVWDRTWLDYTIKLKADIVIITDVRFPNEAQAIWDSPDGMLIRIDRPGLTQIDDPKDPDNALKDWLNWNVVLDNDGTQREFAGQIRRLAAGLEKKFHDSK